MDDLASIAADWTWRTNADHEIVSIRGRYRELAGHPAAAARGMPWPGLPGLAPEAAAEHRRLLETRRPFRDVVVTHHRPDGRASFVRLGGAPVLARDGTFQGYRGIAAETAASRRDEADAAPIANHLLFAAIEQMPQGLHVLDNDLRVVVANSRFLDIYGLSSDIVHSGVPLEQLVRHSASLGNYPGLTPDEAWAVTRRRLGQPHGIERTLPGERTIALSYTPIRGGGYVVTHDDITARRLAESRLEEQHRQLDTALAHMAHGLVLFDAEHRVKLFNAQFLAAHGLSPDLVQVGMSAEELIRRRVAAGNFPGRPPDEVWRAVSSRITSRTPYRIDQTMADGRTIAVSYSPTPDGGFVTLHEDITAQKRAEARIAHMARHDTLTDLPNRAMFRDHLGAALRAGADPAVLCLDLDRFKAVNDTLGHAAGDELLRRVARRLGRALRRAPSGGGALLARLGGDEFAVVLPRSRDAATVAARLIEAVARDCRIDGQRVHVGLSVGIAVAREDGADPDRLLRAADMALYQAKADGRGTFRFFRPELDDAVRARRILELDLRHALASGQFVLHYQPCFSLRTDRIVGVEALVRWNHPTRGLVPPGEFVPLAEETGLIAPLGEWVLRQACRDATRWPADIGVSVNLSPVQFRDPALVATVAATLADAGLDPRRLQCEITEGVLLLEDPATIAMLHALKGLGVGVAMDDFGTGYSSLSYLRSFPFDTIKIDRSFVSDIATRQDAAAIVLAMATLAPHLGMTTTAEGVETMAQMMCLRAAGCDVVQGYLISRPRPIEEILPMLLGAGAVSFAA